MTENGDGEDFVLNGIQEAIAQFTESPGVVVEYVVVASYLDEDGDRRVYSDTMKGQRAHQSLGLIDFIQAHERGIVAYQAAKDYGEE